MTKLIQMGVLSIILFSVAMLIPALAGVINTYVIVVPMVLITVGQALIYPSAMGIALQPYKNQAGYATALFGFIQQLLCCLATLIAACLPHTTQLPFAIFSILIGMAIFFSLLRNCRS